MFSFEEPISFGSLLSLFRRRKELRQKDLADRLGCKRTFISQMEREVKGVPTLALLNRLIAALELNEREAGALIEAAELTNPVVRLPAKMPLSVRKQFIRLARCEGDPSIESWAAFEEELALVAQAT